MKKDRVKEMSLEIIVGAFMFTVLLALGVLTIVFSRENVFARTYALEVVFDKVQGLGGGDNVVTRGVQVGRVKSLHIQQDGVYVLLSLDVPIEVREGYRVEIVPSSILGGQYLSIDAGPADASPLPEGAVLRGEPPLDLVKAASETIQSIRDAMEDGGILENLKATREQVNRITARLEKGEGTLGKLLTDEKLYDDLEEIAANLKEVSKRLADGEGTLGKLMSEDDDLYEEARLVLQEIRAAVDDLRETAPLTTFTSIFFGAF